MRNHRFRRLSSRTTSVLCSTSHDRTASASSRFPPHQVAHRAGHLHRHSFVLADAIASFIWGSYLRSTGAHGGPVSYFRHVSRSRTQSSSYSRCPSGSIARDVEPTDTRHESRSDQHRLRERSQRYEGENLLVRLHRSRRRLSGSPALRRMR